MADIKQNDVECCPACLRPVAPGGSVCQYCLKPLILADGAPPHIAIASEIEGYNTAARRPSGIVLIGMWLIWGPILLIAILAFVAIAHELATAPSGIHSAMDVLGVIFCLFFIIAVMGGLGIVAGRYLYLTTRNYFRGTVSSEKMRRG